MSDEQPIFKVTDRRLFNSDGTPRDVVREEEPKPDTAASSSAAAAATKQSAPASEGRPAVSQTVETPRESASAASATQAPASETGARGATEAAPTSAARAGAAEQFPEDDYADYAESEMPAGAEDPASFINFLMSIASNAAAALGMMKHPVTGEHVVDPELAKHWIDVLGMLHQKTQGNLDPQEQQIFEGLLADLRMQYVSISGMRQPKTPRGFTGSDITGGR
jgi:hypothetical protein